MLQVFLKPEQAHDDNQDVDEAEVGEDGDEVDIKLLVGLEFVHINTVRKTTVSDASENTREEQDARIQPRLGRRAGTEKIGVDRGEVAIRVENGQGK